jgi:peptide/nickel transport system substrate-binding protein
MTKEANMTSSHRWNHLRRGLAVILVLAAVWSGTAPGVVAAQPAAVRGGTLTIGWIPGAKTLDPHLSVQFPERFVLYLVFNTLVGLDKSFNIVPELARSWQVSADGKRVTFQLQRGVKFHDGTDFNAEAVKWNIERVLDPQAKSPQRSQLEPAVAAVTVVDPYTVAFELKKPWAPLLAALGERPGFIVSPAAVKKHGENFGRTPVGTGPFRFVDWIPDSRVTLERFPDYWDKGKPHLDKVVYRVVPDPTVRLTMVRTGEVNIATDVDTKDVPSLQGDARLKVSEVKPAARWTALQWQVDKPPFNNKALRQAIALAINRAELKDVLLLGFGETARGPVTPGLWWFDPTFKGIGYDPDLAKRKLAEAGYPNGFRHKFEVTNTPQWIRQAELLQAQLAKINVTLDIELVNPADAYALVVQRKTNFTHTNWTQRADPHGLLYILFHSKGFANTTGYNNPRVDEFLDRAAAIFDPERRKPLYQEAERLIVDDAPYVFLNYTPDFAVMSRKVQNWGWIPDLIPRFRDLWLEK